MPLRPTSLGAKGALFFATVLTLYLATPYSNLFFLLLAFLAVLGVLGGIGAAANLRGLGAAPLELAAAPAGGAHAVTLRVASATQRRRFSIAVALEVAGVRRPLGVVTVATDGCVLSGSIDGLPRGVHAVTAIVLHSTHPLGICRAERRLPVPAAELVTYPAPATAAGDRATDGERGAERRMVAFDQSVAGLRGWRDGDSLRAVHWRASARRGEPVVREYEQDHGAGLEVVLDRRCTAAALERALAVATAAVLDAAAAQLPLRLRSQAFDAAHAPDRPATATMLRWLAGAEVLPTTAAAPPTGAPTALRLPAPSGGGGTP